MANREPVLLTVLVDTTQRSWSVAGITLDAQPIPLTRSEVGNLDPYVGVVLDQQVDFLRHRLSGVLQRGCDRLWARQMKPRQIVFVANADFEQDNAELTQRVAEHFVLWMSKPPVAFFISENGFRHGEATMLKQLAGDLDPGDCQVLETGLPRLIAVLGENNLWETVANKPTS